MPLYRTYAWLLRFADDIWQASLNALDSWGDRVPGAIKLTNIARQGFSGHHYVIMALCSMVASFVVNALFTLTTKPRETLSPAQLFAASRIDDGAAKSAVETVCGRRFDMVERYHESRH